MPFLNSHLGRFFISYTFFVSLVFIPALSRSLSPFTPPAYGLGVSFALSPVAIFHSNTFCHWMPFWLLPIHTHTHGTIFLSAVSFGLSLRNIYLWFSHVEHIVPSFSVIPVHSIWFFLFSFYFFFLFFMYVTNILCPEKNNNTYQVLL